MISGETSSRTPNASRTSADPTDDEAARLPCLATGTPQPATASEAMVDTLTVCNWSPPVPTMSMASEVTLNVVAALSMASTNPVISATVSPLKVNAVKKLAMSTPSTRPARISPRASRASSRSRLVPWMSGCSTSWAKEFDTLVLSSKFENKLLGTAQGPDNYDLEMAATYLDSILDFFLKKKNTKTHHTTHQEKRGEQQ